MPKNAFAVALLASLAAACTSAHQEPVQPIYALGETSVISGSITYRERIALAPQSTAKIQLLDISLADAPAKVIDQKIYDLTGRNVPVGFELTMPNKGVPENARLSVRAEIHGADGSLLFTTDTIQPVMSRPVDQNLGEIILVRTPR